MRLRFFPFFLLSLGLSTSFASVADEEAALLKAERDGCVAYQKGDADAIAQFLMDDYTLTNSRGKITGKAQDIKEAKEKNPKYDLFENRDMKVRVHGDTGVVLGVTVVKGTSDGKPFTGEFQFTDTFVKVDGHWRLLAGHVTKLSGPPT